MLCIFPFYPLHVLAQRERVYVCVVVWLSILLKLIEIQNSVIIAMMIIVVIAFYNKQLSIPRQATTPSNVMILCGTPQPQPTRCLRKKDNSFTIASLFISLISCCCCLHPCSCWFSFRKSQHLANIHHHRDRV